MRAIMLAWAIAALSGCAFVGAFTDRSPDCRGKNRGDCAFVNAPLLLGTKEFTFEDRPYSFWRTENTVEFVDRSGRSWTAPSGILTDGASIPPVFIPVIGLPTSESFAVAAAIHDAYCGYGNEEVSVYQTRSWRAVHRMFYEALVQGGTPELKAKAMYAAVMTGGPRWGLLTRDDGDQNFDAVIHARPELADVPAAELVAAFEEVVGYIERENPSLREIDTLAGVVSNNSEVLFRPEEERGFTVDAQTGEVFEWQGLPPPAPPGSPSSWLGYDAAGNPIDAVATSADGPLPDLSDDIVLPPPL